MAKFQKAMVAAPGPSLKIQETPMPKPESNQVLVKVNYVAQNPTDVQAFDAEAFGVGAIYGCDFVGEVLESGSAVSRVANGDIIAGLIWGGEKPNLGAYSHYTLADERICFKVPKDVSEAAASTIPLAAATAWLALFSQQCLNVARGTKTTVLVWGGSSGVGQYAIQLAKLNSFKVITTCSPKNFELVKALGAAHVFDYRSSTVAEDIKRAAGNDLKYVFDTIGNKTSSGLASSATSKAGATLCTVRPGKANTDDLPSHVRVTDVLVWTAFLEEHKYGEFRWPPSREDHELTSELFDLVPDWLTSGKLKPNEVNLLEGLKSIPKGFEMYRNGSISAKKIVYSVGAEE